ncbi:hypothetical protein [Flagellimonas meridianipacifica]|uniref:Uncharacterized protein n=1 Tax=Flagellimonas meridianipacifica TaxID=1080225 RepID=A0A2T0M6S3_9FLAO|nr:hypothetical protein [Allomuricauda pacifica]PRX53156.1 hypothetical protein CLV81_4063 [Allomuricauda pacifica]
MKKYIIFLAFILFSTIAFAQTTVTLQDQCNCEVLKGTAVNVPGATTPTGADTGDIYVNTTTGTIFFWDGDSWELTSADNQQLQSFTLDGLTNELTLTLEDGGSIDVDLSSLSDTLTDTNTTVVSFGIDATNTNLVITDSDTNTFSVALVDLAAIIDTNTDDQDLALDGATNTLSLTNDATTVDLSPYLDNTDSQDLTISGNTLSLTGDATPVTLPTADGDETVINDGVNTTVNGTGTALDPYTIDVPNETVTSLSQNTTTGVISYTDEDGGTPETANVVSVSNTNNELIVGTDGGASFEMTDIDIDGDGTDEATVNDAMNDIRKITATAGRIFYPPSIAIDVSAYSGTPILNQTINLYAQYTAQFGSPMVRSDVGGANEAPAALPTYASNELYYYVTFFDNTVFANVEIDANGMMEYDIIGSPADYNSLINVVFVVK